MTVSSNLQLYSHKIAIFFSSFDEFIFVKSINFFHNFTSLTRKNTNDFQDLQLYSRKIMTSFPVILLI